MANVRPKKHLGQHFLKDSDIAHAIVDAYRLAGCSMPLLEIGPGTGVLTQLIEGGKTTPFKVIEIDKESINYLKEVLKFPSESIIEADFLRIDLDTYFPEKFDIIGNFPYNISSQIFFKILEKRDRVNRVTCMIQKEVADRIETKQGGRKAGILTPLIQAFYDVKFEFDVPPSAFVPPPKVMSTVITLQRNGVEQLPCNELLFFKVVKQAYAMRRKTLRNNFKIFKLKPEITEQTIFSKRAEALNMEEWIYLTNLIEENRAN